MGVEAVGTGAPKNNLKTSLRENFREIFAIFSQFFRCFRKFLEVFGLAQTCSDPYGCVWMRSDAFGHFPKISENFDEKIDFSAFSSVFCLREHYWPVPGGAQTFI